MKSRCFRFSITLIVLFVICSVHSFPAQNFGYKMSRLDSIILDSIKSINSLELGLSNQQKISAYDDMLNYVQRKGFRKGEVTVHKDLGHVLIMENEYEAAMSNYIQAIEISISLKDSFAVMDAYNTLVSIQFAIGNLEKAEEYVFKSMSYRSGAKDEKFLMLTNSIYLGRIYKAKEEDQTAVKWFEKAVVIGENLQIDSPSEERKLEKKAALNLAYDALGSLKLKNGSLEEAEVYLKKALDVSASIKDYHHYFYFNSLFAWAKLQIKKGDYEVSKEYLQILEEEMIKRNDFHHLPRVNLAYSQMYKKMGQFELALQYHETYFHLHDSIENAKNIENVQQLQVKFDVAMLEKEEVEDKMAIAAMRYDQELNDQQMYWISLLVISVLIGAGLTIWGLIRTIKQKKDLIKKKEALAISEKKLHAITIEKNTMEKRKLEDEIQIQNKDLTNLALEIGRRNEFIGEISSRIKGIKITSKSESNQLKDLRFFIHTHQHINQSFEKFQDDVNRVNRKFLQVVKDKFPQCTANDHHIISLVRLGLTSKEIAQLKNITMQSVDISRHRLRKKLGLQPKENLQEFLNAL